MQLRGERNSKTDRDRIKPTDREREKKAKQFFVNSFRPKIDKFPVVSIFLISNIFHDFEHAQKLSNARNSFSLSFSLFFSLSFPLYLSVCLSLILSVFVPLCLCLSVSLSRSLSLYVPFCLSLILSVFVTLSLTLFLSLCLHNSLSSNLFYPTTYISLIISFTLCDHSWVEGKHTLPTRW